MTPHMNDVCAHYILEKVKYHISVEMFEEGRKRHLRKQFMSYEKPLQDALFLVYELQATTVDACDFDEYFDDSNYNLRPKIICLCGSTRFVDVFQDVSEKLTLEGNIVLSVGCYLHMLDIEEDLAQKLDEVHRRKIDLADEIFVLNVGGYVGTSTLSYIGYAERAGKVINYLEEHHEKNFWLGTSL